MAHITNPTAAELRAALIRRLPDYGRTVILSAFEESYRDAFGESPRDLTAESYSQHLAEYIRQQQERS